MIEGLFLAGVLSLFGKKEKAPPHPRKRKPILGLNRKVICTPKTNSIRVSCWGLVLYFCAKKEKAPPRPRKRKPILGLNKKSNIYSKE